MEGHATAGSSRLASAGGAVSGVGVLDRAVAIIDVLAERSGRSLAELAAATALPRPTAHRLAAALEAHGIVGRDPAGRYRLGLRLVTWGAVGSRAVPLVEVAQPFLDRLCTETAESTQLFVREGDSRVCVASSERRSGLKDTVPVGSVLPLVAGSGGKVLLAWADDADRFASVAAAELAEIRRHGFAATVAEREPGVASVSAPLLDARGRVRAAISVSGPVARLGAPPADRFGPLLVDAARRIEERSGLR